MTEKARIAACAARRDWYKRNKEKARIYNRKYYYDRVDVARAKARIKAATRRANTIYGISIEEYQAKFEAQGGKCALCKASNRQLVLDHCHNTGKPRGVICRSCNRLVGIADKAPNLLLEALQYVK